MTLTIQELKDKIAKVQEDIDGNSDNKTKEVLAVYLDYLKDELKELEKNGKR
jgi:DNA polymerase III sliding clamp (beta) subunit (PCNA family)